MSFADVMALLRAQDLTGIAPALAARDIITALHQDGHRRPLCDPITPVLLREDPEIVLVSRSTTTHLHATARSFLAPMDSHYNTTRRSTSFAR